MSCIDTGRVRYVPNHDKILDVLGLVRREFRQSEVPTMVGSSDVSRLTDLESSLSWSYRTCPVWTARGQRLVFKCLEGREFRRESEVSTVGSSGMSREFRHLIYFNSVTVVFKCAEGREFQWSEVLAFIGSFDASQRHCNSVTVGAV